MPFQEKLLFLLTLFLPSVQLTSHVISRKPIAHHFCLTKCTKDNCLGIAGCTILITLRFAECASGGCTGGLLPIFKWPPGVPHLIPYR